MASDPEQAAEPRSYYPPIVETKEERQARRAKRREAERIRRREQLLRLYNRSDGLCFYCRTPLRLPDQRVRTGPLPPDFATRDHLLPRSRGGSSRDGNLVAACHRCNNERGNGSWVRFLYQRQDELFCWQVD